MTNTINGLMIVQDGPRFYTAIQLCCKNDNADPTDTRELMDHLLIISGPFESYAEADTARKRG